MKFTKIISIIASGLSLIVCIALLKSIGDGINTYDYVTLLVLATLNYCSLAFNLYNFKP